ncbi:MAG TPA: outer membrane protein assembly factor BamD, partial [Polyangiales bacterium]|nr:outer membrane protein assembly factor BamD [Polyangiales bacterium]
PAPALAPLALETANPSQLLAAHLALLEKKKLAPAPATRVDELEELLEHAYQRELAGRKDEAAMMLLEAVEGPRFRAFEGLDAFAAAELMLASLLLDLGAWQSAQRSVDRLLARGPESATFGPAFRRGVDLALARGDLTDSAEELTRPDLPRDAQSELHYLQALAARDAGDLPAATRELAAVDKRSRFHVRAQYVLGTQAADARRWDEADARFAAARTQTPRTLYASTHLDDSVDLALLGRARVAHERGQSKRASDLYFGIANDSPWLPEALFESAYASYERGRPELAIDTLAQLEARYPHSPYTAEARVLRGYLHLASFDFERAESELTEFEHTFGGVLRELDVTLESPGRLRSLFAEQASGLPAAASKHDALLRGLLVRDPGVERAQDRLNMLNAELARGGQLDAELLALGARVRGQDLPRARNDEPIAPTLRERARELSDALVAFADELRSLREAGADSRELAELEKLQHKLARQSDHIETAARAEERKASADAPPPSGVELGQRIDEERAYVGSARERAIALREQLVDALRDAQRAALQQLRARVEGELRRARIGRIDAVMGKKRKLELEVESLTAGRFPPELISRKKTPVYLRDNEEYWPFEGEDWPDEGAR